MQCGACGAEQDIFRTVAKMDEDLPECCGVKMERRIVAPYVAGDIQPYQSMATGEMIESRSKHREHLKRHHLIEVGNEMKHLTKKEPIKPPPGLKETIARNVYAKL
jgi:hypothetical protein